MPSVLLPPAVVVTFTAVRMTVVSGCSDVDADDGRRLGWDSGVGPAAGVATPPRAGIREGCDGMHMHNDNIEFDAQARGDWATVTRLVLKRALHRAQYLCVVEQGCRGGDGRSEWWEIAIVEHLSRR